MVTGLGVDLVIFDKPGDSDSQLDRDVWDQIDGRVQVMGRFEDMRVAYGHLEAVVALSSDESFNRVVAEAMLNRLPVVATDIPAHRALLGNNDAGLLVPVGDMRATAQALSKLSGDAELRRRLGEEGARRAAKFAPERIIPQIVSLYRS